MLNDVTISLDLNQLLGGDIDTRRTRAYVKTNVTNGTLIDTSTGETRLGDERVLLEADGTGSFTTWGVGADGNPTSWQTSVVVEYPRAGSRDRVTRTFGPYTITDADNGKTLAELEDQQAIPPNYQTAFTADMEEIRDETQAIRDGIVGDLGTTDSQTATLINSPGSLTETALSASYASFVSVESQRQPEDSSDIDAWQRAVNIAIASGIRRVVGSAPSYTFIGDEGVDFSGADGLVISGAGREATVIDCTGVTEAMDFAFTNKSGQAVGVVIEDMTIRGTVVDDVTQPRRSRTTADGLGVNYGIGFYGDLSPIASGRSQASNCRIRRVRIEKTNELPFLFDGIGGYAQAIDVETYLTMDGGWRYCDHAVFDNLRSDKSADNGFSISRGNRRATGGRVSATLSAYHGLWVSGFNIANNSSDYGPTDFVIDSVNVYDVGIGFVRLDDAPMRGRINSIYGNKVRRGAVDAPRGDAGIGILVGGSPSNNRATPTAWATGISIGSATLIACDRGGIGFASGVRHFTADDVLVIDAGSEFKEDGITPTTPSMADQNFGVALTSDSYASLVDNIWIRNLRVIETRTPGYTNYPIYFPSGMANSGYTSISAVNCAKSVDASNAVETHLGAKTFKNGASIRNKLDSTNSTACSVAAGAQASAASAASNGSDAIAGTINITTVASPAVGVLATVTFPVGTFTTPPHVVLTSTNAATADCRPYLSARQADSFTISCRTAPTGSTALQLDYHVIG